MSQVNYDALSDLELKHYVFSNRRDRDALQAYLNRLSLRPRSLIARPTDPDFDEKIQAAIRQTLEAAQNSPSETL